MKKITAIFLLLCMSLINVLPISAEDVDVVEDITDIDGFQDDSILFDQFVQHTMYDNGISLYSIGDSILSYEDPRYSIYQDWKSMIEAVAIGQRNDTQFELIIKDNPLYIPLIDINMNRFKSDGTQYSTISCFVYELLAYLQVDCPYDLYWFDKVSGCTITSRSEVDENENLIITKLIVKMKVNQEYSLTGERGTFIINTDITSSTVIACNNAKNIVQEAQGKSDLEKLEYYRDTICGLVEYDEYSANNNVGNYGNPWQLIYVFDNNPYTNVVCEGYAKAFQYLCDLTYFDNPNINCITVWGTTDESHMWNIITMDDNENYIVDLTNFDEKSGAYKYVYFIACPTGSIEDGYTIINGSKDLTYIYDSTMFSYFGSYLYLSSHPYGQQNEMIKPDSIVLSQEYILMHMGFGTVKLDASFNVGATDERITYTSTNTKVATVNQDGTITPQGVGQCKIKVSSQNHLEAECVIDVRDSISYYITDDVLRIYGSGQMNNWYHVEDMPWYGKEIRSVWIEDEITSLGDHFLESIPNLEKIYIPNSVYNLGINTWDEGVIYYTKKVSQTNVYLNVYADGEYDVRYIEDTSSLLEGYSLTLDASIGVNFYLNLEEWASFDDKAMIFAYYPDGSTQLFYVSELEQVEINGNTYYVLRVDVSAKDCTQSIELMYINSLLTAKSFSYSVEEYANYILNHYERDSLEVGIMRSLMTYAYFTQIYFDYNVENLPFVHDELRTYDTNSYSLLDHNDSIQFIGARLKCSSDLMVKLYFVTDLDSVYVDGESAELIDEYQYKYILIPVNKIKDMYSITCDNFELNYGPMNFVNSAYNSNNQDLINLVNSLVKYYLYFS